MPQVKISVGGSGRGCIAFLHQFLIGQVRQEGLDEVILVVPWQPQKPYFSVYVYGDKNRETVHGEGSNSGFINWPLTQVWDQEAEVNSFHGFWEEK